jgi:hypothetical protein
VQSLQIDSKLSRGLYFSSKGKERDLNFNPSDPRVADQENLMKEADTLEKKIGVILKTKSIMQKELLFDVEFFAFLNAYMHLKMKNVEEDLKHGI